MPSDLKINETAFATAFRAVGLTLKEAGQRGKNLLPPTHCYVARISPKQATREMRRGRPKNWRGRRDWGMLVSRS